MSERAGRVVVAIGALVAFALGWRLLVSPSTRTEEALRAELARLGDLPSNTVAAARLEGLGRELLDVRGRALDEPGLAREPGLEGLIALSQRSDRTGEAGRMVRAGKPRTPHFGGPVQAQALPVEIHLETTLEPTLALVEAIEAKSPTLRIESIEIVAARTTGRAAQKPLLVSTLRVEALYQPPTGAGEER